MRISPSHILTLVALLGTAGISGCGLGTMDSSTTSQAITVQGKVQGGHTPIENATITLYIAGKTGYGSAATAIATGTTDVNGLFTLGTRSSACSDPDQLYITSTGGDQGGVTNTYMVLVEALGTCSTVTPSTNVSMNEATTVAAAYALSGFANVDGASTDIGTSSTNASGLTNAFANALNLVGQNGLTRTVTAGGNGTIPTAFVNRLANSLAACVNSNGGTGACTSIAVAPPTGATTATPANVWQIGLNWALYPGNNVTAALNNQISPIFFIPNMTTNPPDLSMAITYTIGNNASGSAAGSPYDIKADINGNIWVAGVANSGLAELDPNGVLLSPTTGGFDTSNTLSAVTLKSIALDTSATPTVWVGALGSNLFSYNTGTSTLSTFALPGSITVGGSASSVGVNPEAMSVDPSNNVWYATYGGASNPCSPSCYLGEVVNTAGSYAIKTSYPTGASPLYPGRGTFYIANDDNAGRPFVWSGDQAHNNLFAYKRDFTTAQVSATTTAAATVPENGVAIDASGNAWFAVQGTAAQGGVIEKISSPGGSATLIASPAVAGKTGLFRPKGVAIDAKGHLFLTENTGASLVEYDTSSSNYFVSNGNGFQPVSVNATGSTNTPVLTAPGLFNLTVDPSGAVWVSNLGTTAPVVQILGLAAPTRTPLANNATSFLP